LPKKEQQRKKHNLPVSVKSFRTWGAEVHIVEQSHWPSPVTPTIFTQLFLFNL